MNRLKVLVASADPQNRAALIYVLAQCGLAPLAARSVGEVENFLRQRLVHLVICEDVLPQGGFRSVLRLTKGTGAGIPLVVSAPRGELGQYLEAMQLGALDFIVPPYRRTDVESLIRRLRSDYLSKLPQGSKPGTPNDSAFRNEEAAA